MCDSNSLRCLLDDDAEAMGIARRRKLRSLALSVSLQMFFLIAVVVLPLVATGKLPLDTHWASPLPPYRGVPLADAQLHNSDTRPRPTPSTSETYSPARPIMPTRIPPAIAEIDDRGLQPPGGASLPGGCLGCQQDGLIEPIGPITKGPVPPMPEVRPTTSSKPVIVSTLIQEAKLIHRIDPVYPPLCKQMRLEGEVVLRAIISREGVMSELTYVRGPACFVPHTMNAVAQWRYRPTILNGQPVEVETIITVIYKLSR